MPKFKIRLNCLWQGNTTVLLEKLSVVTCTLIVWNGQNADCMQVGCLQEALQVAPAHTIFYVPDLWSFSFKSIRLHRHVTQSPTALPALLVHLVKQLKQSHAVERNIRPWQRQQHWIASR
jgi:hypothetical protein